MTPASRLATALVLAATLTSCTPAPKSAETSSPPTSSTESTAPIVTPVLADVVAAPIAVPATDGRVHLAYELLLTNSSPEPVTVDSVSVMGPAGPLLQLSGAGLAYWTRTMGTRISTNNLGPGQRATVWLDVSLPAGSPVPQQLSHRVVVKVPKPMPPLVPPVVTENVAPVPVSDHKPAVIEPPLRGAGWLDGNSCCDMTPHRMALNPIDGKLWGAERFAIDYEQLQPDGRLFTGDGAKNTSYAYFGADVHAVAAGPVVAVLDGLPEQVPGQNPTGLTLAQYGGNHVVQDIGNGNFAFYAHLQTGSVTVKPGDQLNAGQVLGHVGNTGNSTGPHLHFHVMSTADPLRSDGLPFVFRSFRLTARVDSMAAGEALEAGRPAQLQPGFTASDENNVSPLNLDVMTYDN
ncbi:M23 family metallopeptidase [Mycolicibacterium aubagnense]|uniref:Peptidase M23 n=1 Tax=Mycolicibacterium aubagnense TaxID=319707 RepID=A0ABM7IG61_9MYCO|nr:M23 family metallopeptidase [Mycolicibacterium aubagnense]TLH70835.1 peptidase M23 [Mycolicibacterium aubagnense]WGI32679.1 M23 family metallopeptidase [Mycolicibacterium aubagnense]BBX85699.1 peptidase M23 [Mycolicibacterium aubagnense]